MAYCSGIQPLHKRLGDGISGYQNLTFSGRTALTTLQEDANKLEEIAPLHQLVRQPQPAPVWYPAEQLIEQGPPANGSPSLAMIAHPNTSIHRRKMKKITGIAQVQVCQL